jgi:hypothetical protein
MSQVVEHLPSIHKVLGSHPIKKKKSAERARHVGAHCNPHTSEAEAEES